MEELSLTIQSRVDSMAMQMLGVMTKSKGIEAQMLGVMTKSRGSKQAKAREEGKAKNESNFDWKSIRLELKNVGWNTKRERREANESDLRGSAEGEVEAVGGVERRGGAELDDPVASGLDGNADVGGDDEVEGDRRLMRLEQASSRWSRAAWRS
ncbi:hypothetical protein U1Q18_000225 [Sarracenia purpurea var. burkii]